MYGESATGNWLGNIRYFGSLAVANSPLTATPTASRRNWMQESVPSVWQLDTAVRLYGRLLTLPVRNELGEPSTALFRLGSMAFGKPGFVFGMLVVDAELIRAESALWLTRE